MFLTLFKLIQEPGIRTLDGGDFEIGFVTPADIYTTLHIIITAPDQPKTGGYV
jgi:hypothetical protein